MPLELLELFLLLAHPQSFRICFVAQKASQRFAHVWVLAALGILASMWRQNDGLDEQRYGVALQISL